MIPLPTSAGRRWQMVWQGPRLGFVAETGRFVFEYDFLACFCDLLPTFRFSFFFSFFSFFFPASRYVCLRVPSSVQQPSATLRKYVFYSTCSFCLGHLCPTPYRKAFIFYSSSFVFFRSSYFSGGVFLLCSRTRYAST